MIKAPKRLAVKFSLRRQPQRQPDHILPIFQRWIQEHTVPGMLIDVIDYKHVPDGPAVVLIADEADYAYDLADGSPGLNYVQKRDMPAELGDATRLVFLHALLGAQALEAEAPDDLVFDYSSAKVSFLDRMEYRNESAVYARIRDHLAAVMGEIYAAPVQLVRVSEDPRRLLAVQVSAASDTIDPGEISARLQADLQLA